MSGEFLTLKDNPSNARISRDTIATLMSTSGTTGMPKMAAKSHQSIVMENLAIEDNSHKPYEVSRYQELCFLTLI